MNVSALLQDAPSDDLRRRQQNREQHAQPQAQDRQRDRQQPPLAQQQQQPQAQQQQQQQRTPQPLLPQQHPPQPPYLPSQSSRHTRPPSPQHPYAQDHGRPEQSQRLPPPSAIISDAYDHKHRRPEHEPLPHPHELAMRAPHGPPALLGPPAANNHSRPGPPPPPYLLDHRTPGPLQQRAQPPPSGHGMHHLPSPHAHPSAPPSMYMPPPASRSGMHASKSSSGSASGPGLSGPPGHGGIPLYSPIGPGMGPPHDSRDPRDLRDPRGPPSYNEPSPMYSGHPHAPPGASIMGALPPHPAAQARHRRSSSGGAGGFSSQNGSPAMSSLQRPEDRDFSGHPAGRGSLGGGPGGPPSQLGGSLGHLPGVTSHRDRDSQSLGLGGSGMNTMRGPPMLSGPGAGTLQEMLQSQKEREREREREMGREMGRDGRSVERREREREQRQKERERRDDERLRERERPRDHEMLGLGLGLGIGMLPPESMPESEREWARKMHAGGQVPMRGDPSLWSRFTYPRTGMEEQREREIREMEKQRGREMAKFREADEMRMREAEWEAERAREERFGRQQFMGAPRPPSVVRERDGRDKEAMTREREPEREREPARRESRHKESRKSSREEHGWLPDPREAWPEKVERDTRERERMQLLDQRDREREREAQREEMDPLRGGRPQGAHHHHHHLHHHHHHSAPSSVSGSSQGYGPGTKPPKALRPAEPMDVSLGQPGIAPGSMPPPSFGPPTPDRPPPPGFPPHKQISKMSNGMVGPGPVPSALSQLPPQHLHPSHHVHLHPHDHALANPPLGFPLRRTPPPQFPNSVAAPQFLQQHPPRPPPLPTLPPLNLGTFVYPHTPFPFLDFPSPAEAVPSPGAPVNITDKEIREIRATIYIPSGFLPTQRPRRPQIWGGAPIPSFHPLFATPQLVHHLQSGMSYGFRRPHPYEIQGMRRVYTDDSDLLLCALHSGWISWSTVRAARKEGKDLKLEVRLTREARFVGGLGSTYIGGDPSDSSGAGPNDNDGTSILSYGWGNSHDGSGVEILRAVFVKKGTAHKTCLRNRGQRLLEYTARRSELSCGPTAHASPRKRRRYSSPHGDENEESPIVREAHKADQKLCTSRTLVFSNPAVGSAPGFKYEPQTVKSALFCEAEDVRPRKKIRLSTTNNQMDVDSSSLSPTEAAERLPIVIETLRESFMIVPYLAGDGSEDKENAPHNTQSGQRYMVALLPRGQPAADPRPAVDDSQEGGNVQQTAKGASAEADGPPPTSPTVLPSDTLEPSVVQAPEAAVTDDAPHMNGIKEKLLALDLPLGETSKPPPGPGGQTRAPSSDSKGESEMDMSISPASESRKTPATPSEGEAVPATPKAKTNGGVDAPQGAAEATATTPVGAKPATEANATETADVATPTPESSGLDAAASMDVEQRTALAVKEKHVQEVQVLNRNLGEDDFVFDADGISILVGGAENGTRKGWKIEARAWRWATEVPKSV